MSIRQIELTDVQINNLMIFLDRVELKGFKEIQAMNEIVNALTPKIVESDNGQNAEQ